MKKNVNIDDKTFTYSTKHKTCARGGGFGGSPLMRKIVNMERLIKDFTYSARLTPPMHRSAFTRRRIRSLPLLLPTQQAQRQTSSPLIQH
jgi:hypothetical protein